MDPTPDHDSADARLTAARAFLASTPVVDQYAQQIAETVAADAALGARLRAQFVAHRDTIESLVIAGTIKHLTAAEIQALAVFQASTHGRAILRKMGAYQADLVPSLMPLLRRLTEAALRGEGPPEPPRA